MLGVNKWNVRYMAKRHKWRRPAHMAPLIHDGVINGSASPDYYPGLDFEASANTPVGYESDFLQHITRHPDHVELMEAIAKKGLVIEKDILTVADLKNKVCPDLTSRNTIEELFGFYMLEQLDNDEPE